LTLARGNPERQSIRAVGNRPRGLYLCRTDRKRNPLPSRSLGDPQNPRGLPRTSETDGAGTRQSLLWFCLLRRSGRRFRPPTNPGGTATLRVAPGLTQIGNFGTREFSPRGAQVRCASLPRQRHSLIRLLGVFHSLALASPRHCFDTHLSMPGPFYLSTPAYKRSGPQ